MTTPGAYPPGPASQGNYNLVIAATPGEPLAEALAAELRNIGWRASVAEQIAPYVAEARACVALITPTSLTSPALAAALATQGTPLIPLVVGGAPLPPGPWAVPPIAFSGDPAQAARDIAVAASNLPGMHASGGATMAYPPAPPYAPAPPSQPFQPYQAMPAPPSQPYQPYQAMPAYPTQPGYTAYPQGAAPYAAPAAPPKRRRWPVVVGVIAAVLLVLCVGGGAFAYARLNSFVGTVSVSVSQTATAQAAALTPQATATLEAAPTPIVPANYTLYTDSSDGFSVAYPNSWAKHINKSDVVFIDNNEPADMVIGAVDANVSQSEIKAVETQFFKSAAGSGGTYHNVHGPVTVTLAGESWTQESADISASGQTVHAVVLMANHGSRSYVIGYLATKSSFASLDTRYFQPILQTFSFVS
ncbi:MAG TPA: PsbP-related protein [Ktedonobacterales bacterium]|nr:PsbP-related protein [Ktedonobacterales bacterium]